MVPCSVSILESPRYSIPSFVCSGFAVPATFDIAGQEREAMCVKIAVLVVVVSVCGWTDAQDGEWCV